MKSATTIEEHIAKLKDHIAIYDRYRDVCIAKHDRHGVMDAEADMREMEAKVKALEWVLTDGEIAA